MSDLYKETWLVPVQHVDDWRAPDDAVEWLLVPLRDDDDVVAVLRHLANLWEAERNS
jgi:hypothetical protein